MTTAADLIARLGLEPHPEGGWYRQTFRDDVPGGRARSTAIYFLLERHQRSHWHRVDAVEVWHWYAGAPLELSIAPPQPVEAAPVADGSVAALEATAGSAWRTLTLGIDFAAGQLPQGIVPTDHWQSARSLGDWTLVGCTVAPGFEFDGFELAPQGWEPR